MSASSKSWLWPSSSASTADFEALYREQMPRVYNFFRYRFGDNALAEDLTAITFEKAWKKRGQYRHDRSAFTTWLFTIARRVGIDHMRCSKPTVGLEEIDRLSAEQNVEQQVQHQADLQRLKALLPQLPERDQELVALKYGGELTNRAIAALCGLSESNVGVILFRAVQTLREAWEDPHE